MLREGGLRQEAQRESELNLLPANVPQAGPGRTRVWPVPIGCHSLPHRSTGRPTRPAAGERIKCWAGKKPFFSGKRAPPRHAVAVTDFDCLPVDAVLAVSLVSGTKWGTGKVSVWAGPVVGEAEGGQPGGITWVLLCLGIGSDCQKRSTRRLVSAGDPELSITSVVRARFHSAGSWAASRC